MTTAHLVIVPHPRGGKNCDWLFPRAVLDAPHMIVVHELGHRDVELLRRPWDSCTLLDVAPGDVSPAERSAIMAGLVPGMEFRVHVSPDAPEPSADVVPHDPHAVLQRIIHRGLGSTIATHVVVGDDDASMVTMRVDVPSLSRHLISAGVVVPPPKSPN